MHRAPTTLTTLLAAGAMGTPAVAQPFTMTWHTIDGGVSETSTGGGLTLNASVGQPDAMNATMTGGSFSLQGGFWANFGEGDPGCLADIDGDGDVDGKDFFAYLDLFANGDPEADIEGDGDIDAEDFFLYLDLFAAGC